MFKTAIAAALKAFRPDPPSPTEVRSILKLMSLIAAGDGSLEEDGDIARRWEQELLQAYRLGWMRPPGAWGQYWEITKKGRLAVNDART